MAEIGLLSQASCCHYWKPTSGGLFPELSKQHRHFERSSGSARCKVSLIIRRTDDMDNMQLGYMLPEKFYIKHFRWWRRSCLLLLLPSSWYGDCHSVASFFHLSLFLSDDFCPAPPSLSFSSAETLSTNKAADLLIWGLCGCCCLQGCVFVCVSVSASLRAYMSVCFIHLQGRSVGVGGRFIWVSSGELKIGMHGEKKITLRRKASAERERFIAEWGWSILKSRAWKVRNKWVLQNEVPEMQNNLCFTCIKSNCTVRKEMF